MKSVLDVVSGRDAPKTSAGELKRDSPFCIILETKLLIVCSAVGMFSRFSENTHTRYLVRKHEASRIKLVCHVRIVPLRPYPYSPFLPPRKTRLRLRPSPPPLLVQKSRQKRPRATRHPDHPKKHYRQLRELRGVRRRLPGGELVGPSCRRLETRMEKGRHQRRSAMVWAPRANVPSKRYMEALGRRAALPQGRGVVDVLLAGRRKQSLCLLLVCSSDAVAM